MESNKGKAEYFSSRDENKNKILSPSQQGLRDLCKEIKDAVNIVDVVEFYNLKSFSKRQSYSSGRGGADTATAICPFHNDNNPSLSINQERQMFKCFSCGVGGDAFQFVRKYHELGNALPETNNNDGSNPMDDLGIDQSSMSYYQAVQYVAKQFGPPHLYEELVTALKQSSNGNKWNATHIQQRAARLANQQRLRLCNAAAADYFAGALRDPSGGAARTYIRKDRALSPGAAQTFALGYAPTTNELKKTRNPGLVEHLKTMGFTTTEIVDAGLAFEIQDTNKRQKEGKFLIDRFRGRLMVPIFDMTGTHVIGFGGRVLPQPPTENTGNEIPGENNPKDVNNRKGAKYLNSAESDIFSKKRELFGFQIAKLAIQEQQQEENGRNRAPTIVIVEGYLDVIKLWDSGIRETVACMGTALSKEQLEKAAKAVVGNGMSRGRIVLCLDNDEAGIAAMERVCMGNLLLDNAAEIAIARLPQGFKDPAEYIESMSTKDRAAMFRSEIIDKAKDWIAWYTERILSRYDPTTTSSFGEVCERLSDFLSTLPVPTERTRRAHSVAKILARMVTGTTESNHSTTLEIQLESDLLDMVSRKAARRVSIERRIESADGFQSSSYERKQIMEKLSRGGRSTEEEETEKLSSQARRELSFNQTHATTKPLSNLTRRGGGEPFPDEGPLQPFPLNQKQQSWKPRRQGYNGYKNMNRKQPSLTPHFDGFDFENKNDLDWMGLPKSKWKRKIDDLTLGGEMRVSEEAIRRDFDKGGGSYVEGLLSSKAVYFNSNLYHGKQFLTDEAKKAGYKMDTTANRDPEIAVKGVGLLVAKEREAGAVTAENTLLRQLVQYKSARLAIHAATTTTMATTGASPDIAWSSDARAWLFDLLVNRHGEIPAHFSGPENLVGLRDYLANRSDVPVDAFGTELTSTTTAATTTTELLDDFETTDEVPREKPLEMPFNDGLISRQIVKEHATSQSLSPETKKKIANTLEESGAVNQQNTTNSLTKLRVLQSKPRDVEAIPLDQKDSDVGERDDSVPSGAQEWGESYEASLHIEDDFDMASQPPSPDLSPQPAEIVPSGPFLDQDLKTADRPEGDDPNWGQNPSFGGGSLDDLFQPQEDLFEHTHDPSVPRSYIVELSAQEALSHLTLESAKKKVESVKSNLAAACQLLQARREANEDVDNAENGSSVGDSSTALIGIPELEQMSNADLHLYSQSLVTRLKQLTETVSELDVASERITSKLMDLTSSEDKEGVLSPKLQDQLTREVSSFVDNIPDDFVPEKLNQMDPEEVLRMFKDEDDEDDEDDDEDDEDYNFEDEEDDDDGVYNEVAIAKANEKLRKMDEEWGDWANEEYEWASVEETSTGYIPDKFTKAIVETQNIMLKVQEEEDEDDEEESIEETLNRLENDWDDWIHSDDGVGPAVKGDDDNDDATEQISLEDDNLPNEGTAVPSDSSFSFETTSANDENANNDNMQINTDNADKTNDHADFGITMDIERKDNGSHRDQENLGGRNNEQDEPDDDPFGVAQYDEMDEESHLFTDLDSNVSEWE